MTTRERIVKHSANTFSKNKNGESKFKSVNNIKVQLFQLCNINNYFLFVISYSFIFVSFLALVHDFFCIVK